MPDTLTIPETVTIRTELLIDTCADLLALEERMVMLHGQETWPSEQAQLAAFTLLNTVAPGLHGPEELVPGAHVEALRHPAVVEAFAREQERLAEHAAESPAADDHREAADRVRRMRHALARYEGWVEEQAAGRDD